MKQRLVESGLFMTEETLNGLEPHTVAAMQNTLENSNNHVLIVGPQDVVNGMATLDIRKHFHAAGIPYGGGIEMGITAAMDLNAGTAGSAFTAGNNPMLPQNACIVTVPMADGLFIDQYGTEYNMNSAPDLAAAMIDVHPDWIRTDSIPVSVQDMQIWTAHHEIDHCNNSGQEFYEYASDTEANRNYARDLAAGRAGDPELPYYIRSHRAAAAITGKSGEAYITNGIAPLAGEKPLTEPQLRVAKGQIQEASDRIYDRIEENSGMTKAELMEPEHDIDRSRMVYENARIMMEQGKFNDIPFGKQAVGNFIDGAQRYGTVLYDVAPQDMIMDAPVMHPAAYGHTIPDFGITMRSGPGLMQMP